MRPLYAGQLLGMCQIDKITHMSRGLWSVWALVKLLAMSLLSQSPKIGLQSRVHREQRFG